MHGRRSGWFCALCYSVVSLLANEVFNEPLFILVSICGNTLLLDFMVDKIEIIKTNVIFILGQKIKKFLYENKFS